MKNPIRKNLTLVRVLALAAMSLLPCSVSAQSTGGGFDVLGVLRSLDAENRMLTVDARGEERLVEVLAAARILDAMGQALPRGLEALELVDGTVVTLTLAPVSGDLAVMALRLGGHIPDQEPIRGPTLGLKPLTEMSASDRYKDEDGGLYGGGRNEPPASHLAAAKLANGRITPMSADGEPASDGKIGFVSISMSNATMEFSLFKQLADQDDRNSDRVVIVDCAQNGQGMAQWVDPTAPAWIEADRRLAAAEVSAQQVQVTWLKLANPMPKGDLDYHGRRLYLDALAVLQNAKRRFPNLRIAYLGSRIYAGHSAYPLNPEPYAYEGAFAARWLILDQIQGADPLRYDDAAAPGRVPLLLWGPYLWADGTTPRTEDGLTWEPSDLMADGVHPTASGCRKVVDLLIEHFTTDALARDWFVKN